VLDHLKRAISIFENQKMFVLVPKNLGWTPLVTHVMVRLHENHLTWKPITVYQVIGLNFWRVYVMIFILVLFFQHMNTFWQKNIYNFRDQPLIYFSWIYTFNMVFNLQYESKFNICHSAITWNSSDIETYNGISSSRFELLTCLCMVSEHFGC
jgi:hypothetical protein